ncbi:MAG: RagB/SusD family nutrient uptake outer membrane protein [Bacteroidales bacterium]
MKKNIQKTGLIFLLAALQFSCSDWMELIPPQGLIRQEFWKTKEDVRAVLMGAYDAFSRMDGQLFKYGEMRADMVSADYNVSQDEQKIMSSIIYPNNYMTSWASFYKVIDYCNEVIRFAPEVRKVDDTFTDYQLQGYLSEAYFLRSLSYFYLVRIFKDVPFVLNPTVADDSKIYLPKTSGDEILQKMIEDLKMVRPWATIDGYPTLREVKGRATKAAIDALLADIYLWTFDYVNCIQSVEFIEESHKYTLGKNDEWFENYYPINPPVSKENIFEFLFDDSKNQKNSMYGLTQPNSHNYDPSEYALRLFADPDDPEPWRNGTIRKISEGDYIIWKYAGRNDDAGLNYRDGLDQNSCSWIVYRYSDVLLMKAEALSQMGNYTEALTYLNYTRSRAGRPQASPGNSPVAFEDAIMEERARELAFEGKRWFDLMRMGRRNNYARASKLIEIMIKDVPSTQKRILQTKLRNPLGWYLPVSKSELEYNKELVQNPYYNF